MRHVGLRWSRFPQVLHLQENVRSRTTPIVDALCQPPSLIQHHLVRGFNIAVKPSTRFSRDAHKPRNIGSECFGIVSPPCPYTIPTTISVMGLWLRDRIARWLNQVCVSEAFTIHSVPGLPRFIFSTLSFDNNAQRRKM